jgi:hypothetical protein
VIVVSLAIDFTAYLFFCQENAKYRRAFFSGLYKKRAQAFALELRGLLRINAAHSPVAAKLRATYSTLWLNKKVIESRELTGSR